MKSGMFGSRPSGKTATLTPAPLASEWAAAGPPSPKSTFIDCSASGSSSGSLGLAGQACDAVPPPSVGLEAPIEL